MHLLVGGKERQKIGSIGSVSFPSPQSSAQLWAEDIGFCHCHCAVDSEEVLTVTSVTCEGDGWIRLKNKLHSQ